MIYVNPEILGEKPKRHEAPKTSVLVKSTVNVLLTDSEGRRAGTLPNGTLVQEFPAYTYRIDEDNQKTGWYFGLFEGTYNIVITGRSTGEFRLLVSGEAARGAILDYGSQPITQGAQAEITIGTADHQPPLSLPDGTTVMPSTSTGGVSTESDDGGDGGGTMLILVAVILGVVVFVMMRRRGRGHPSPTKAMTAAKRRPSTPLPEKRARPPSTTQTEPPPPMGRFCTNCGAQVSHQVRFCEKCGAPVTRAS